MLPFSESMPYSFLQPVFFNGSNHACDDGDGDAENGNDLCNNCSSGGRRDALSCSKSHRDIHIPPNRKLPLRNNRTFHSNNFHNRNMLPHRGSHIYPCVGSRRMQCQVRPKALPKSKLIFS